MQGKQFLFLVRFENVISVAMADPLVVKVDVEGYECKVSCFFV